jgi:hypothetical protein
MISVIHDIMYYIVASNTLSLCLKSFKQSKIMKKQFLILALILTAGVSSYAQCDKKNTLTASSTRYLNSDNEIQKIVDEVTTVEYDSKNITIMPGDHTMEGTVNSITCDWKTPYKEGKTVIKGIINNPKGDPMTCTVTIEGKNGKTTLLFEAEESPNMKIQVTLDKFEEKK